MNPIKIKLEFFGYEFLATLTGRTLSIKNFPEDIIEKFASWTSYQYEGTDGTKYFFTL